MMKDRLECPACAKLDFWHVEEVREHDLRMTRMAVWIDGKGERVGAFELFLCAACGLTEWWARGVDIGAPSHVGRQTAAPQCPSCGGREAWDVPMQDIAAGGEAFPMAATRTDGHAASPLFSTICRGTPRAGSPGGCGLTHWRIATDEPFVPDKPLRTESCRGCRSAKAVVVSGIDAMGRLPGPTVIRFSPRSTSSNPWTVRASARREGRGDRRRTIPSRACP